MTSEERWRLWKGACAVSMVLNIGAMAVALVTRSVAGVVVVLGLSPVLMIALLVTIPRRRAVPPHLQGLDHDQRRLVAALATSGARAPDPVLAEAVVAQARRQRTGHVFFLMSGEIGRAHV